MTKPFDYVNSINLSKKNMMRDSENDALAEKDYNAWIVNTALSYFPDTILHANLVNMHPSLDNRPQYEFLLNSIRPKKRFAKWVKADNDSDIDAVSEYYKCSKSVAKEYLRLLSDENLQYIKHKCSKGGTTS